VASDGSGNLFVADFNNHTIRKVVVATATVTTFAGSANLLGGADGIGTAAQFYVPSGIASDGEGNLFVTDYYNHTVRRIDIATAAVTTLAGSPGSSGSADGTGTAARFYYPTGVASDRAGNLFVADSMNHTIRKIVVASQTVSTLVGVAGRQGILLGPLPGELDTPAGLTFSASGQLFITEQHQNAVLMAQF
jgi:sugar lactone lactonase YvrE